MGENQREHRPEPERTAPNRSFAGIVRPPDPWASRDEFWHRRHSTQPAGEHAAPAAGAAPNFATVAGEAVDLAYKLSETYLREGRRAAESLTSQQSGGRDGFGGPIFQGGNAVNQPYGDPMVQMYGQIARAYGELMASLARAAYGPLYGAAYPYSAYPRPRDYGCASERPRDCSQQPFPPPPKTCEPSGPQLNVVFRTGNRRSATLQKKYWKSGDNPRIPWLLNSRDPTTALDTRDVTTTSGITTITIDVTDSATAPAGFYVGPVIDSDPDKVIGDVAVEIRDLP